MVCCRSCHIYPHNAQKGNEMLILASESKSRFDILKNAGLEFEARPAFINEADLKASNDMSTSEMALKLAVEKAKFVAKDFPNAFVIGADQILELDGKLFSKPADITMARKQLKKMRGKTHTLINGLAVVKNNEVLWSMHAGVRVKIRDFSDNFLETYLQKCGDSLLKTVGAYYIEGVGAQLIEKLDGDYFSVLGLPLLPLLDFLRTQGIIEK